MVLSTPTLDNRLLCFLSKYLLHLPVFYFPSVTSSIEIGIARLLGVEHQGVERTVERADVLLPNWSHLITPMSHKMATMRVFAYI